MEKKKERKRMKVDEKRILWKSTSIFAEMQNIKQHFILEHNGRSFCLV